MFSTRAFRNQLAAAAEPAAIWRLFHDWTAEKTLAH